MIRAGVRCSLAAVAALAAGIGWMVLGSRGCDERAPPADTRGPRAFDEDVWRVIWGEKPFVRYDPVAYLVKEPNQRQIFPFPEHPAGEIVAHTNELGFHEDEPTPPEPLGPRILLAADSHAAVIENRNTFPNVAERLLRAELGREDVEVLNAGVAYTGPACYLGMLRKHLALQPDVFVAVLFTGNDFMDDLRLASHIRGWTPSPAADDYRARSLEVTKRWPGTFYQGLNQAYRFAAFPAEAETAVELVLESLLAMQELCRARGVDFLLVLLPTKMDIDRDVEVWQPACAHLGLDEREVSLNLELGRRVLARAHERGVECLDPTDEMRRAGKTLYWKQDCHLGLEGHPLLGALLAARLRAILVRRGLAELR